jgi:hypothetical protein
MSLSLFTGFIFGKSSDGLTGISIPMLLEARWLAHDLPGRGSPLLSALILAFWPPPAGPDALNVCLLRSRLAVALLSRQARPRAAAGGTLGGRRWWGCEDGKGRFRRRRGRRSRARVAVTALEMARDQV